MIFLLVTFNFRFNPLFKTTVDDNLLHVRREPAYFLLPSRAVFLYNNNLRAADVPEELPTSAAGQGLLSVVLVSFTETLYKTGHLNTQESIVDTVTAEDVTETTGNDERNLLGQDSSSSLLAEGATAKGKKPVTRISPALAVVRNFES